MVKKAATPRYPNLERKSASWTSVGDRIPDARFVVQSPKGRGDGLPVGGFHPGFREHLFRQGGGRLLLRGLIGVVTAAGEFSGVVKQGGDGGQNRVAFFGFGQLESQAGYMEGVLPEKAPLGFGSVPGEFPLGLNDQGLDFFQKPGVTLRQDRGESFFRFQTGHGPIIPESPATFPSRNAYVRLTLGSKELLCRESVSGS